MNLSMLLFNEESLATSEDAPTKVEDSKHSFTCDESVDDLNDDDSMDATSGADGSSNRAPSAASDMAPELERSVPLSEGLVPEVDGAIPESGRIPKLEKAVAGEVLADGLTNSLASNIQSPTAFLQGLAMNAGISTLYMPIYSERKQHKTKREWRNIGMYTSEEAMNEVRKREKVSKRKTVVQINGTKVFYRCNNWRRTSCNYRMHAIINSPSQIALYASGEHDHTTKNPHYVPRTYSGSLVYDIAPCSSQQQILNQLVANATANPSGVPETNDQENVFEKKQEGTISSPQMRLDSYVKNVNKVKNGFLSLKRTFVSSEPAYQLGDGPNIAALLQVAAEMGHSFKFNSRSTREYCIESNKIDSKGKMLVFADHGTYISVTERLNGCDQKSEEWKKADWQQFLYAVRGKCRAVLA